MPGIVSKRFQKWKNPPDEHCPGEVDEVALHRGGGDKLTAGRVDLLSAGGQRHRPGLEPEVLEQNVLALREGKG
jgi:hypothetical protein